MCRVSNHHGGGERKRKKEKALLVGYMVVMAIGSMVDVVEIELVQLSARSPRVWLG